MHQFLKMGDGGQRRKTQRSSQNINKERDVGCGKEGGEKGKE